MDKSTRQNGTYYSVMQFLWTSYKHFTSQTSKNNNLSISHTGQYYGHFMLWESEISRGESEGLLWVLFLSRKVTQSYRMHYSLQNERQRVKRSQCLCSLCMCDVGEKRSNCRQSLLCGESVIKKEKKNSDWFMPNNSASGMESFSTEYRE